MTKTEAIHFLTELSGKIKAQNNRATATPYFYVIHTEKWRVAHDDYHHGDTKQVWVDVKSGEGTHYDSKEEAIFDLMEKGHSREEVVNTLEEFTLEKYIEEENVFLTQEAYEDHVRLNGHNLCRGGEYYSYVKHAFRNPEMTGLLNAIHALAEKEGSDGT